MNNPLVAGELSRARSLLRFEVTEKDFQRDIVRMADLFGWWSYHVRDSRGSAPGWPDLALIKGERLILAEVKTEKGRVRPEQEDVLERLGKVRTVEAHLWRPSDVSDVENTLRGTA